MPVIGRDYTKKVILDGYPDEAFVEVLTNPKADLFLGLDDLEGSEKSIAVVSRIVRGWNFTEESGQIAPITPETIKSTLSVFDLIKIESEIGAISGLPDAKKNS
jgi:hypothetical protein